MTRIGLASVAMLFAACGSDPVPLEAVADCTATWQPLTAPSAFDVLSPLAFHDGEVYYSTGLTSQIRALSVADGSERVVASDYASDLWLEGDHLLFTAGSYGDQFIQVALAGGTPELLLDAGADRIERGASVMHLVTDTEFFWNEHSRTDPRGPSTFLRASRTDRVPTEIGVAGATLSSGDRLNYTEMGLTEDGLVLASIQGVAEVLPFGGGPRRPLAGIDWMARGYVNFTGIDAAGVYWSAPKLGARREDDMNEVLLAPADGGPVRPFWTDLPAHVQLFGMWPDGEGGWMAAGTQMFDDHEFHVTIWTRGADGTARRLACSPDVSGYVHVRPAKGPDALYVAQEGDAWQLVRIPTGAASSYACLSESGGHSMGASGGGRRRGVRHRRARAVAG